MDAHVRAVLGGIGTGLHLDFLNRFHHRPCGRGTNQVVQDADAVERHRVVHLARPGAVKSSPGGGPVGEDFVPRITPGVIRATCIGSRPLSGNSAMLRVLIISETAASSVLMAATAASTVIDCEPTRPKVEGRYRTVWLVSTMTPVFVTF